MRSTPVSITDTNDAWQRRSLRHVWHPCTQMKRAARTPPLPIRNGSGPWLFDHDGHRYFDATSSWWVNLFGHGDAGISAALIDQLGKLEHVMLAGCTHAPAVELAERLSDMTRGTLGHCFYASDGASAVEIALKMSFHAWQNLGQPAKREFVCLQNGYHGETLGALAVTDVTLFRDVYDPLLMRAQIVKAPDPRQYPPDFRTDEVVQDAVSQLRRLLKQRHERIAAVIIEPLVQCAAGMAMHDASYLGQVRALCDRYGVHLIADEIAVGCGRTGTFFAFEQAREDWTEGDCGPPVNWPRVWPDFLCLSKGITGGFLPLSLVLTRNHIYEAFLDDEVSRGFLHSHSYTGNPLACRAALATLDRFEQGDVLERNRESARHLTAALAVLERDKRIEHLRHIGMIWAFDVREELAGQRFAERFHLAGRDRELLIRPIGRTVYLMPPYVLDEKLARWLAARVCETLDAVSREKSAVTC